MSDRNYYVLCDSNCKFPAMTAEQTLAAIAEATGKTGIDCDKAYITKIKEQNANSGLKFWVGTTAEYNALAEKIENCFYILTDESTAADFNAAFETLTARVDWIAESTNNATINTNKEIKSINEKVTRLSTDYVIETGASGVWTFRKWKSGYCELVGNVEFDFLNKYFTTPYISHAQTFEIPFALTSGAVMATVINDEKCWVQRAGLTDDKTVALALCSTVGYSDSDDHIVGVSVKIDGYIEVN